MVPTGSRENANSSSEPRHRFSTVRCVKRRGRGRANEYRAVVQVADLIDHTLRGAAARLCDGSLAPLLTHLVNTTQPDADQVEELRQLVRRLDKKGGSA